MAAALGGRWTQTAGALGDGDLNLAQARVIVEALDALPDDLGDDLTVKAEAYLVEQAGSFGPRELRHLGRGVLEHLAPEIADEAEYQRLLAEETRAPAATRLSSTPGRRVHRPPRQGPRPRRQPAEDVPGRLHLTAPRPTGRRRRPAGRSPTG